ncbi:MAG: RNA polymerase sigma-70 factor [Labilibaculum sp.]|nr:RNA polymerase sigma-70 factor [Labilibaculum sp.]
MNKLNRYNENDLIVRLNANDQFAFEVLFYKYKNKLKGFVIKLAPSQVDSDEIVQKVFIKVWVQRTKIDPRKSFSSFLFTIAKNEVIDQLRSSISKRIYFMGHEAIADLNISDQSVNETQLELEQKVTELIKKIPERRRQIFELSRYDGLSYKQIAKELNISENTVDTQIRKSLNYLREELRKIKILLLIFLSK